MDYFNQMMLFLLQVVFIACLVTGVFHLRRFFGLTLLFVMLGTFQFLQVALTITISAEILPGIIVSPGSVALFPVNLYAVLLMYLCGNIRETRTLIYGLVIANISLSFLAWMGSLHLDLPNGYNFHNVPEILFRTTPRVFVVGTATLFLDVLLTVFSYEFLSRHVGGARVLRIFGSLFIVLLFDAVFFVTGSFWGTEHYSSMLLSHIVGKSIAALLYAVILEVYLRYGSVQYVFDGRDPIPFRNLFNSLTLLNEIKALKKTEERYAAAVRGANDGLWDWDFQRGVVFYSARFLEMIGAAGKSGEYSPDLWLERIHPEDREGFNKALKAHRKGKTSQLKYEFRTILPGGLVRWMLCRGIALRDEKGKVLRIAGSQTDVTEQRKAEQARDEFLSIVSHELRTPVAGIRGALGLLDRSKVSLPREKEDELVKMAARNCERLELLVDDILDIQKLESGRMEFNMVPLDLVELVGDAVESAKGLGLRTGITFSFASEADRLNVHGDPVRLGQVLQNLLSNAAKFSSPGSTVEIVAKRKDHRARIEVTDHGKGIEPTFHERVFEKFSQQETSSSREIKGSGLGLSICKVIVERHGGSIDFYSEPNKGSTFWFELNAVV